MNRLEKLIEAYEAEIFASKPDLRRLDKLCMLVEREADRTDYKNHRRLMVLHTMAERSAERALNK